MEAKGAILIKEKFYKLVSFADNQKSVNDYSNAYNDAGYKTVKKKIKGGYALYAIWK